MEKFYITTPIYYVNDEPHLGHAYTTTAADIIARWNRKLGKDVFFLTGTDEHGLKIKKTALEKGYKNIEEFVDTLVPKFKELWKNLNISYDFFIRTTDNYHIIFVKDIIKRIYENGDIYKGIYKGYYCVSCEQYYTKTEAKDLICPIHKKPLIELEEETYFFSLSKYGDKLLEYYSENPDFISPSKRATEIINRVKGGLKDLSITRKNLEWGIKFPYDEDHYVYVWFDALSNYLSALVATGQQVFWPTDVHLVGKDILWFHSVIWPAMLLSAGYELPKKVFAHGWWTVEGEKMSKTTGNVIKPIDIVNKYGLDSFRYYLFKVPFGEDVNFSEKELIEHHNNELANDLGNLVSRVISMVYKYFDGEIGNYEILNEDDLELTKKLNILEEVNKYMINLELHKALEKIWESIREINGYINKVEPWKIKDSQRLTEVLGLLVSSLKLISEYLEPFLPDTSKKIAKQLNVNLNNSLTIEYIIEHKLGEKEILFEKIDFDKSNKDKQLETKKENKKEKSKKKKDENITLNDLNLKVGKIIDIKEHPNAEKLYIETVDLGENKIQIVSGLKDYYKKDELLNKFIIVVTNLKPAKLRGELSEGMLLASENKEGKVGVLTIDESLSNEELDSIIGKNVFSKNYIANNENQIKIDDFLKVKLISKNNKVFYENEELKVELKSNDNEKKDIEVKVDNEIDGNIR